MIGNTPHHYHRRLRVHRRGLLRRPYLGALRPHGQPTQREDRRARKDQPAAAAGKRQRHAVGSGGAQGTEGGRAL